MTGPDVEPTPTPELVVLFEDDDLLAVAKPAGLLTQRRGGGVTEPALEDAVRVYLDPADPASVYLGTVHRLDRPVSGVVVWARSRKAARRVSSQFAARRVTKEYWTLAEARSEPPPPGAEGVWDDWLTDHSDATGVVRVVAAESPGAKRAVTRFRREAGGSLPGHTVWLRLWPETGRTHQLRVQSSHRGWPVWGDATYGSTRPFPRGIALHARSLTFEHPAWHAPVVVRAPVPLEWAESGAVFPETAPDGPALSRR